MQVAVLRNLKKHPEYKAAESIAEQIAAVAQSITNGVAYDYVSAVPSGGARSDDNFASLLADAVARRIGAAHEALLIGKTVGSRSSSHPKQSLRFRAAYRDSETRSGLVLLVDDVATTGLHFEKCVFQLQAHGHSVVCLSWIA